MLIIIFTVLGALLGFWSKFKPDFDTLKIRSGTTFSDLYYAKSVLLVKVNQKKYALSALLFAGISYIGLLLIKRFTKRK